MSEWHTNKVTPDHGTKAFVLWTKNDRLHTATWLDGRWITSAGYTVYGMDSVQAWAQQPSVEEVLLQLGGKEQQPPIPPDTCPVCHGVGYDSSGQRCEECSNPSFG